MSTLNKFPINYPIIFFSFLSPQKFPLVSLKQLWKKNIDNVWRQKKNFPSTRFDCIISIDIAVKNVQQTAKKKVPKSNSLKTDLNLACRKKGMLRVKSLSYPTKTISKEILTFQKEKTNCNFRFSSSDFFVKGEESKKKKKSKLVNNEKKWWIKLFGKKCPIEVFFVIFLRCFVSKESLSLKPEKSEREKREKMWVREPATRF